MGNLRVIRCSLIEDDVNVMGTVTSTSSSSTTTTTGRHQDDSTVIDFPRESPLLARSMVPSNQLQMDIMQGLHRAQRMRPTSAGRGGVGRPFSNVYYHPVPASIFESPSPPPSTSSPSSSSSSPPASTTSPLSVQSSNRNNSIECTICNVQRPFDASHCYKCGVCVEKVNSSCFPTFFLFRIFHKTTLS